MVLPWFSDAGDVDNRDDDDGDREDTGDEHGTTISIQNNAFLDVMLVFKRCRKSIHDDYDDGGGGHDGDGDDSDAGRCGWP